MSFLAVLDPTWPCETGGGRVKRGADRHYTLAKNVRQLADEYRESEPWDRVPLQPGEKGRAGLLWMWATSTAVVRGDAHGLAALLGFRLCCGFVWCKVDVIDNDEAKWAWRYANPRRCIDGEWQDGPAALHAPPARMGLGQWSRVEHEHLLLCRRGDVKVPPPPARCRSVIYAPRGRHSEKPEAAWRVIETTSRAVLPGVVGCEWNARTLRPGWHAYGRLDGEGAPPRFEQCRALVEGHACSCWRVTE